ncbi:MAG: gliding motility-associated peptidyl-prolyl isomerase GldI [Polaribacter sp.]|jgi:FKBP-type peptidyl-prolyl cis-trans isomerase FkpA
MKYNLLLIVLFLVTISCSKKTARRPLKPKPSTTVYADALKKSKLINKKNDEKIAALVKNDSLNTYIQSTEGFWYTYNHKINSDLPFPKMADEVIISYSIKDLNDSVIYSEMDLGTKSYVVDKEDFITGLQKGIKLMKEGETVTFIIPPYNAYGILGDQNKIKYNQSIKSTVTLIKLNKK